MAKKIILDSDTIKRIIDLYQSGQSAPKIGELLGYRGGFIRRTLHDNNIDRRKSHEINRKHLLNEHFFDQIDTEEKAYFLGLLFSDGNVHTKYNSITLKLHKKDKYILSRLSKLISATDEDLLYDTEENCALKFSSKHIKNRLIELGCVPNKSLKLTFPQIPEHFINHFIRGYIDGDGSIIRGKDREFKLNCMSTESFNIKIKEIIYNICNIIGTISHPSEMLNRGNDITTCLLYGGNRKVTKILNWLYYNATIYLERKHDRYLELLGRNIEVDLKRPGRYL